MLERARPEQRVLYQFVEEAGKPFQPSNGTEGEMFMSVFCERCSRECVAGTWCRIMGLALGFSVGDKDYPVQWKFDDLGWPLCTAWKDRSAPRRPSPCPKTPDMFGKYPVKIGQVDNIISKAKEGAKPAKKKQKAGAIL